VEFLGLHFDGVDPAEKTRENDVDRRSGAQVVPWYMVPPQTAYLMTYPKA